MRVKHSTIRRPATAVSGVGVRHRTLPGLLILALALLPAGIAGQSSVTDGWTSVAPGGGTRCAFDTPFEFWVREADPARVFIYLQGGGACWSLESCDPRRDVSFDSTIDSADVRQRRDGIFDASDTENPFRHHTAIFVPYCTGDLHLGARVVRYGDAASDAGVTVHHVGEANVKAVLDYLATRKPTPRLVTVIGASAGGVASPAVAAEVARRLPSAGVRQVADGAGAFRVPQLRALLRQWAADSVLVALGMPVADSGDVVVSLYTGAAARHPDIRFAQVGTTADAVVGGWLRRFGDDRGRVADYIAQTYRELESAGLCFTGYTVPGSDHTVLWRGGVMAMRVGDGTLGERIRRDVLERPCVTAPRVRNVGRRVSNVRRLGPQDAHGGDVAFLFAYRAKPDLEGAFAQGYRRHLDWHAARHDSLTWLAWTVIDGPSLGTFVDGAFGIRFKAFDDRVDPRGDAEDAARNVTAFATPVNRQVYRLRRDLGGGARLEDAKPGAMQRVVRFSVRHGGEAAFERAIASVRAEARRGDDYAIYELVSGGEQPAFILITQIDAWSDFDAPGGDLSRAIARASGAAITRAESEVWLLRPELNYVGSRR